MLRSTARSNGLDGINVSNGFVRDSFAFRNNGKEILVSTGTIDSCVVENEGAAQPAFYLGFGLLRGSHARADSSPALHCQAECALAENKFSDWIGAACFTGGGLIFRVPPASNICGGAVCPP